MKKSIAGITMVLALTISVFVIRQIAQAQNSGAQRIDKSDIMMAAAAGANTNNDEGSSIFVTNVPPGYRDWRLISMGHLEIGTRNQLRAQLGNDIAIKAYPERQLPFPDGTIIVALHWNHVSSEENNQALTKIASAAGGDPKSAVAGTPVNVQFMLKDSKKYAATGGWGFGDFTDGKPASRAVLQTCFPCHRANTERDLVFARYAP